MIDVPLAMPLVGSALGNQLELAPTPSATDRSKSCNRAAKLLHGIDRRGPRDIRELPSRKVVYVQTVDGYVVLIGTSPSRGAA